MPLPPRPSTEDTAGINNFQVQSFFSMHKDVYSAYVTFNHAIQEYIGRIIDGLCASSVLAHGAALSEGWLKQEYNESKAEAFMNIPVSRYTKLFDSLLNAYTVVINDSVSGLGMHEHVTTIELIREYAIDTTYTTPMLIVKYTMLYASTPSTTTLQ